MVVNKKTVGVSMKRTTMLRLRKGAPVGRQDPNSEVDVTADERLQDFLSRSVDDGGRTELNV
jgi:hypothetical protein